MAGARFNARGGEMPQSLEIGMNRKDTSFDVGRGKKWEIGETLIQSEGRKLYA